MNIYDDIAAALNDAIEYEKTTAKYEMQVDPLIIHRCPHCGESYYRENYSTTTCMAWYPVYKDGVLMNSDPNKTTVHCTCINCGKDFSYEV